MRRGLREISAVEKPSSLDMGEVGRESHRTSPGGKPNRKSPNLDTGNEIAASALRPPRNDVVRLSFRGDSAGIDKGIPFPQKRSGEKIERKKPQE